MTGQLRVGVVGAGAWGTAVAALASRKAETVIWAREPEVVASINFQRENALFLPGFTLPSGLRATGSLEEAVSAADVVFLAVPAQHARSVVSALDLRPHASVVNVTKSTRYALYAAAEMARLCEHDRGSLGVLSGPNLAREVIAGQPSATCVAFAETQIAIRVQELLMQDSFRVYTSDDVIGCEIGGALKNVIAIAAGVADGLGYGTNTKAALITRGLAELARLGAAAGGRPLTFLGLSGNGDLVATCSSPQSRNYRFGQELAQGRAASDVLAGQTTVTEGAATAPVAVELAARLHVDVPIAASVVALLRGDRTPQELVVELMGRDGKTELTGIEAPMAI